MNQKKEMIQPNLGLSLIIKKETKNSDIYYTENYLSILDKDFGFKITLCSFFFYVPSLIIQLRAMVIMMWVLPLSTHSW